MVRAIPLLLLVIICTFPVDSVDSHNCHYKYPMVPEAWLTMETECKYKMRDQVQTELEVAMSYMSMGAYFSRDTVNRPGFAKYFFESASEEREHAIKIISYLLMRTDTMDYLQNLINEPNPTTHEWTNGVTALEVALGLETTVTNKIVDIIKVCENHSHKVPNGFDDYNLVDYLSGDFLEEQYKSQRQLAGMISTLKKMFDGQGVIGEYIFDKKLLNNELF